MTTSQSRCTLSVRGLDCPNEVGTLRGPGRLAGIDHLGFDLINGLMTVDYAEGATDPGALVRLIRDRAAMEASLVGRPEAKAPPSSWWSRNSRLAATTGSGMALGLGLLVSHPGLEPASMRSPASGWPGPASGSSVAIGGAWLFPLRPAEPAAAAARHRRPDGPGDRRGARPWASGTRRRPSRSCSALSEALEALSLDRARRAVRTLLEIAPETAERIEPDGQVAVGPGRRDPAPATASCVRAGDTIPIDGEVAHGAVERRSEGDHRRVGPGRPRAGRPGLRRDGQRRGHAGGRGLGSGRRRLDLADRRAGPRRAGRPGAGRAEDRRGSPRIYTPIVVAVAVLVMVVPLLLAWATLGGSAWPGSLGRDWFGRGPGACW